MERAQKVITRLFIFITAIPIAVIVIVLVVPAIVRGTRASNERAAGAALRKLVTAQIDFQSRDRDRNGVNDYWTGDVASLHFLEIDGKPLRLVDEKIARADRQPITPREGASYDGYWFRVLRTDPEGKPYAQDTDGSGKAVHHFSRFAFSAAPESATGYTLIVNEKNELYRRALGGPFDGDWPREAWPKAD